MSQTKLGSFTEAWANVGVGFTINLAGNLLILPAFGLPVTVTAAMGIGAVFTIISVLRSYYVRRLFNWLHARYGWFEASRSAKASAA